MLNRKISTPIAISVILILAVVVGIIDYWQYIKIRDFEFEMTESKIPEKEKKEDGIVNWQVYRNEEYGFEFKYPDDWVYFEEEEKHEELLNKFGWVYYVNLRPKDKKYSYEGTEEYPVNIRILDKLDKFDDNFRNSYSQEEKIDFAINNIIPATKFITKMGKDTAWELTVTEESNNLGYYFEFFNPIYVLSDGAEENYLLEVFDKILSTFRFLDSEEIVEVEELCFKGELEGPIVKEITDDSLPKLIIRVLIEEAKNYGVLKKEKICAAQCYLISGEKIQLNEDEIPEYIIFPKGFYTDNKFTSVRGASGNGPIYIIGFIQGKWKLIGNFGGSWVKPMKSRRTKGYLNLVTHWHMSAKEGEISEYAWDGEMYKLIKTTEYSPEALIPDEYQELYE